MGRRLAVTGRFTVGEDRRMLPTADAAISLAQTLALGVAVGRTLYVRELGVSEAVARVTREDRAIVTERLRKG